MFVSSSNFKITFNLFISVADLEKLSKEIDLDAHYVDLHVLCERYGTNLEKGMTSETVELSRKKYGWNKLKDSHTSQTLYHLANNLFGGFALVLWLGSILCFVAYALRSSANDHATNDNLYLAVALVGVALVTGFFSFYQQNKSIKIMKSFDIYMPHNVLTIRDGVKQVVKAENLVPGDIVEIVDGDIIPADIRILSASGLKIDNSTLTGETRPLFKSPELTDNNPLETKNMVYLSTYVVEGSGRGVVINIGQSTIIGRIAGLTSDMKVRETFISKEINFFIKNMIYFAILLGVSFFIIAVSLGYNWIDAVIFLIGTVVAMVPEGLLVTVTVSLALSAQKLASKNCLVKNLETVETLGSTSIICSDKTGTLTQNKIFVSHVWLNNQLLPLDVTESQCDSLVYKKFIEWQYLQRCIALCNNAEFKVEQHHLPVTKRDIVGEASEAALLRCVELSLGDAVKYRDQFPKVAEIPFNHINKLHLSIHENVERPGHILVMSGAPELVWSKCSTIMLGGKEVRLSEELKHNYEDAYRKLCNMGERVVGFCHFMLPERKYPLGYPFNSEDVNFPLNNFCFLGMISLVDPPRPGVPEAIARCRSAGIKVIMITGDHPETAKAVAKEVGIISKGNKTVEDLAEEQGIPLSQVDQSKIDCVVIHGAELEEITDDDLDELVWSYSEIVFARMTPEQKLMIVESCQRIGAIVAVTGDGVNDCPALKKADVGIAMGICGSSVSKKAADLILLDDNFATIVAGIEEGRLIFDNLKKSIAYTLTSNIPEMSPFLMFITLGIPLALGTVTIICIDLGTDILPAVSLAYELPESDLMKRYPRNPYTDKLVGSKLISMSFGQIGMIQTFAGFFTYIVIMAEHGFLPLKLIGLRRSWDSASINDLEDSFGQQWTYQDRKTLEYTCHTAFFVSIVIVQWTDVIISKTRKLSIFSQGMKNWILNFALIFETCLALFLSYTPGTDKALRMYPLKWTWWLPALPFSALIFIYDEIRKFLIRNLPAGSWFMKENYY